GEGVGEGATLKRRTPARSRRVRCRRRAAADAATTAAPRVYGVAPEPPGAWDGGMRREPGAADGGAMPDQYTFTNPATQYPNITPPIQQ
ncbi:hypothetical protein, partial [Rathayibacter rathayi]|uniref:hypothetical protein n=1 Tax=Rathayibacter rathayi TaxID=33887 RepID=UPI001CA554F3